MTLKKSNRLTPRDKLILEHIAVYRMSMTDSIHKLFFHGKELDAVKSTLRRLGKKQMGLIKSENIKGTQKVYYRLTSKGCKTLGLSNYPCGKLGDFQLPQAYSLLWFTSFSKSTITRKLCRPKDYPELFNFTDNLKKGRMPKVDFYVAETTDPNTGAADVSLGIAITDFNSNARRIVDRAKKQIARVLDRGWFAELIVAGKFELTVITGTWGKKHAIELKLKSELQRTQRHRLMRIMPDSVESFPIAINVSVVPGLFDLIPGKPKKGENE